MTTDKSRADALTDTFRGDDASLVSNIKALLELDAEGALVPHGVGGHGRKLLAAAAVRLASVPPHEPGPKQPRQFVAQSAASADERSVLTYLNQPDNVGAWRLGEACRAANPGGDPIDHGLSLLKELQAKGFGVVALDAGRAGNAS